MKNNNTWSARQVTLEKQVLSVTQSTRALILAPWDRHKRSGHPSQRDTYFENQLLLDEGLPYTLDTLAKVLEPKEEKPCNKKTRVGSPSVAGKALAITYCPCYLPTTIRRRDFEWPL
jgi:hypothetical protein